MIGILLVALVAADLGHFLDGYQPVAPARDVYGFTPRSIAFVRAHQGSYRSTAIAGALPSDMGMVWGLRDIRGYDPPLPTLRYWRFFQKGSPPAEGPPNGHPHFFRLTAADRLVLDALSVRYVLTGPGARAPSLPGFRIVYRGNDATVLENLRARPRAFVAGGSGSVAFVHDGNGMVSLAARLRRPGHRRPGRPVRGRVERVGRRPGRSAPAVRLGAAWCRRARRAASDRVAVQHPRAHGRRAPQPRGARARDDLAHRAVASRHPCPSARSRVSTRTE